jgi:hypothetical protein
MFDAGNRQTFFFVPLHKSIKIIIMAFVRLSALVTSLTGKLGGSYFSQKKGGTTLNRCGSKLTKADSGKNTLQTQQNLLAFTSRSWRQLVGDERLAWKNFAGTLTWKNKAGFDYTPTGYEVYCSCNLNVAKITGRAINLPVVSIGDAVLTEISLDWDPAGKLLLKYTGTTTTNNGITVSASAPQSAGVRYPKGGFKTIFESTVIETGDTDLSDSYLNTFGYQPTTGVIFFKVDIVVLDSGIQNGSKLTKADSGFL